MAARHFLLDDASFRTPPDTILAQYMNLFHGQSTEANYGTIRTGRHAKKTTQKALKAEQQCTMNKVRVKGWFDGHRQQRMVSSQTAQPQV